MQDYTCDHCGTEFRDYPSNRTGEHVYCSQRCMGKGQRKERPVCEHCGENRVSKMRNRYCSKSCSQKAEPRGQAVKRYDQPWHVRNRDAVAKQMRERYWSDPEERKRAIARSKARRAHPEPHPCERCGAEDADRHHDDYDKPLDIRWLCRSCHVEEHKAEYGSWGEGLSD